MRQTRPMMLLGACLVGVLAMTTAHVSLPPGLRLVLGILIVFVVPGFALATAVLPDRQLARSERLLASIGLSVVITVCAAVALAAAPIGLSRQSIALALGIVTLLCSAIAAYRIYKGEVQRSARSREREWTEG